MLNLIDNYVGNFEISVFNKITTTEMNFKANINFNIIKIDIENKNAQIQLVYNIEMKDKATLKDLGVIKLTMNAILNSDTKLDKDAFEKKLFNEGIYNLEAICRAYIMTATANAGMPVINIPSFKFEKKK
jgi:hypothetical protein